MLQLKELGGGEKKTPKPKEAEEGKKKLCHS